MAAISPKLLTWSGRGFRPNGDSGFARIVWPPSASTAIAAAPTLLLDGTDMNDGYRTIRPS